MGLCFADSCCNAMIEAELSESISGREGRQRKVEPLRRSQMELLRHYGIRPVKRRGQHFLVDGNLYRSVVRNEHRLEVDLSKAVMTEEQVRLMVSVAKAAKELQAIKEEVYRSSPPKSMHTKLGEIFKKAASNLGAKNASAPSSTSA